MTAHRLGRFRTEVEVTTQPHAALLQDRLSDFARHRLPLVIDDCFAGLDADRHIDLGRVIVDLGMVADADFEDRAEAALREALWLQVHRREQSADAAPATPAAAALDALSYYLTHGLASWRSPAKSLNQLLQEALELAPGQTADLLRAVWGQRAMRQRLLWQARPSTLLKVTTAISPDLGKAARTAARHRPQGQSALIAATLDLLLSRPAEAELPRPADWPALLQEALAGPRPKQDPDADSAGQQVGSGATIQPTATGLGNAASHRPTVARGGRAAPPHKRHPDPDRGPRSDEDAMPRQRVATGNGRQHDHLPAPSDGRAVSASAADLSSTTPLPPRSGANPHPIEDGVALLAGLLTGTLGPEAQERLARRDMGAWFAELLTTDAAALTRAITATGPPDRVADSLVAHVPPTLLIDWIAQARPGLGGFAATLLHLGAGFSHRAQAGLVRQALRDVLAADTGPPSAAAELRQTVRRLANLTNGSEPQVRARLLIEATAKARQSPDWATRLNPVIEMLDHPAPILPASQAASPAAPWPGLPRDLALWLRFGTPADRDLRPAMQLTLQSAVAALPAPTPPVVALLTEARADPILRRRVASLTQSTVSQSALKTVLATLPGANPEPDAAKPNRSAQPAKPIAPKATPPPRQPRPVAPPADLAVDPIPVENAGLVILWPFIEPLCARLALTEGAAFVSEAAQQRAVHLTQALVTDAAQTDEHLLPLNKLLCGLPTDAPVPHEITLGEDEADLIDSLLRAVCAAWPPLINTSAQGLQETFLARPGLLSRADRDGPLLLTIETRAFDVLLDQLPWILTPIKLPWMQEALHVKWR
ncbi:contractile injection system tape measure protein [Thalassococcus sp. BH17M4-6]|uniref:contractile injection system tape measure protein n=1 Tax=Thalassococcus sp. BH17M4-6 TaxID=3413148 RepID=UPI003BC425F3